MFEQGFQVTVAISDVLVAVTQQGRDLAVAGLLEEQGAGGDGLEDARLVALAADGAVEHDLRLAEDRRVVGAVDVGGDHHAPPVTQARQVRSQGRRSRWTAALKRPTKAISMGRGPAGGSHSAKSRPQP